VVVIVASAMVFGEALDRNAMIGSAVAIAGVLLYSLAEEAGKKDKAKAH
jgi:drug/metabolite transporter (DMT)-like permease